MAPPSPPPWVRTVALVVTSVAIGLAVLAGVAALSTPAGDALHCASYPACLSNLPGGAAAVHVWSGEALGIAILAMVALAIWMRASHPRFLRWALPALVLVILMGGIGAGLSTGDLPAVFLIVQTIFLGLLLALLGLSAWALGARSGPRSEPPAAAAASP